MRCFRAYNGPKVPSASASREEPTASEDDHSRVARLSARERFVMMLHDRLTKLEDIRDALPKSAVNRVTVTPAPRFSMLLWVNGYMGSGGTFKIARDIASVIMEYSDEVVVVCNDETSSDPHKIHIDVACGSVDPCVVFAQFLSKPSVRAKLDARYTSVVFDFDPDYIPSHYHISGKRISGEVIIHVTRDGCTYAGKVNIKDPELSKSHAGVSVRDDMLVMYEKLQAS